MLLLTWNINPIYKMLDINDCERMHINSFKGFSNMDKKILEIYSMGSSRDERNEWFNTPCKEKIQYFTRDFSDNFAAIPR